MFPDQTEPREPEPTLFTIDADTSAEMEQLCRNVPPPQGESTTDTDTFRLQPEMEAEMRRLVENAASPLQHENAPPQADSSTPDAAEEPGDTGEDGDTMGEQEGRMLRSSGKEIKWNPEMGNEQVILEN